MLRRKTVIFLLKILITVILTLNVTISFSLGMNHSPEDEYNLWKWVGAQVAIDTLEMMKKDREPFEENGVIVLTNAGYANVNGHSTQAALDGLSQVLPVSRGNNGLIEIHSSPYSALWFAVYHTSSGRCAYLQIDPSAIAQKGQFNKPRQNFYAIKRIEIINAEHLYKNAPEFSAKFNQQIFGGNAFRIVTIANAITKGAPVFAIRSFEFHDHYCPGVTSGILMALYINRFFPLEPGGQYFVQSVQPWCKEDALLVMLNTTPGKKGYALTYPTEEDKSKWIEKVKNAATIIYRKDPKTLVWSGQVLAYESGSTGCKDYGHKTINKLCANLWYLKRLDQPQDFIKVVHEFTLPPKIEPKAYARPGVDPMNMLGLTK